jgi:hypothetical protein
MPPVDDDAMADTQQIEIERCKPRNFKWAGSSFTTNIPASLGGFVVMPLQALSDVQFVSTMTIESGSSAFAGCIFTNFRVPPSLP